MAVLWPMGVAPVVDQMRENRLKWLGHVLRSLDDAESDNEVENVKIERK